LPTTNLTECNYSRIGRHKAVPEEQPLHITHVNSIFCDAHDDLVFGTAERPRGFGVGRRIEESEFFQILTIQKKPKVSNKFKTHHKPKKKKNEMK
jgi:hypothetical protein